MTVMQMLTHMNAFYSNAMHVMRTKGPDYAPDNTMLVDLIVTSAMTDTPPELLLYLQMEKHMTALRRFAVSGTVPTEGIDSRCQDVANFAGLMTMLYEHREELIRDVMRTLKTWSCGCGDGVTCTRCEALSKLEQPCLPGLSRR